MTDEVDPGHETDAAPHVIVVGGGIAGLVMARRLLDADVRVTLIEASDRLGGKLQPHSVGGIELDSGAESFATRGGTMAALVADLGLSHALVTPVAGGAWLQPVDGDALPLPAAGLLGIPSVPLAKDVIAVVGFRGALRAQLDELMLGFTASKERSLGALVRRRMGSAVLDRLVTPVAGAIHSAHPDDLDVDVVAPNLRKSVLSEGSLARAVQTIRGTAPAGSAVQGLYGGVFLLAEALAADVAERAEIRLSTRVTAVTQTTVRLVGDDVPLADSVLVADRVVLAAPLDDRAGTPITLVTLVVDVPALDAAPRGTGVLVAPGALGLRAKALTHATAKWAWLRSRAGSAHVVRLSYDEDAVATALADGGNAARADGIDVALGSDVREHDRSLIEQARKDAARMLGVEIRSAAVLAVDRTDWTGPPAASGRDFAGVVRVGEVVAGAGLAGIVAHCTRAAANLVGDLEAIPGLRWTES